MARVWSGTGENCLNAGTGLAMLDGKGPLGFDQLKLQPNWSQAPARY